MGESMKRVHNERENVAGLTIEDDTQVMQLTIENNTR